MAKITISEERVSGYGPHPDIVCKTCVFAYGDGPFADGPEKANCMVYTAENGTDKPDTVYYSGAACEYHATAADIENQQKGGE